MTPPTPQSLWLALLAVCALAAFSTAPASAAEFHSALEGTILDGKNVGAEKLTLNAGTASCAEVTYTGNLAKKTTTTMTLAPIFKPAECTVFGFVKVTIDNNNCEFLFHLGGANTMDIICPGNPIEITAPNCTVTINSQNGLGAVAFNTEGVAPNRDIKVTYSIIGIKYTQHGKGFFPCTNGVFGNGLYEGAATVTGTDGAKNQVDIWYA